LTPTLGTVVASAAPLLRQLTAAPADAHYPDDIWADEVLLGQNILERSCVHLQDGDRNV
jgi:hypothetical protein